MPLLKKMSLCEWYHSLEELAELHQEQQEKKFLFFCKGIICPNLILLIAYIYAFEGGIIGDCL